jgi:hypothetical protein
LSGLGSGWAADAAVAIAASQRINEEMMRMAVGNVWCCTLVPQSGTLSVPTQSVGTS